MPRSHALLLALALPLAACAQAPTQPEAAVPVADPTSPAHCDAGKVADLAGQLPTSEVLERARAQAGAERVRTLKPNQPVTKEFMVGRLNLVLDEQGRIARAHCS